LPVEGAHRRYDRGMGLLSVRPEIFEPGEKGQGEKQGKGLTVWGDGVTIHPPRGSQGRRNHTQKGRGAGIQHPASVKEETKMSKRANGEGNIRKRTDGRWLVTFPTGLYKENGKREYVYKYCNSQAEAAEALRQLQSE